jgi:Leucine-rich repeat (LRR) protein
MDCLKQINIFFCKNLKNIEPIGKLQQLEKITFQGCKNISSIESLSELKNLKTLFYINNVKIETLENLYPLINLEQIDLFDTEILDGKLHVLEYLYKNHKLKKINFKNKKYYSHTREQLGFKAFKLT